MLVFGEREKPKYPEKNLSEQNREPTNSTHGSGNRTWNKLAGGKRSHPAASLLSLSEKQEDQWVTDSENTAVT